MGDLGSLRTSKRFNAFWIYASFLWLPLCFINFDPHHDGIILTTVNQLKLNMHVGGAWPFNQYGSAWVFPYLLVSYLVPQNLLLLSIRLVTVFFYVIATYLLFKSAFIVFGKRTAQISVILYLVFQPFLGPWNTSLLPWPSSLVTLLVSFLTFILVTLPEAEDKTINKRLTLSGFIIAVVLGSRIQVGLLILIFISLSVVILNIGKLRYLIAGLSLWLIPFSILLHSKGWLIPSLYDSIVLGSQFLSSDHLHYPFPILSVIAGVCTFAWIRISTVHPLNRYIHALIFLIAFLSTIILSKRVLGPSFNLANYMSVTQRKILAGLFFAALIQVSLDFAKLLWEQRFTKFNYDSNRKILLYIVSISSAAQAWPFFDQMHIWWSFLPLVIVIADKAPKIKIPKLSFLIACLVIMTYLVFSQSIGSKSELNSINQRWIFTNQEDEKNESKIQKFLLSNIPPGSHVLNLCPNAYPFFISERYKSESRFFVYWSNFESAAISYKDYSPHQVTYVLVCQTYLYQGEELTKYIQRQKKVLDSLSKARVVDTLSVGGFNLQVYINGKLS